MRATGVVRRIDELGRIVVPKEIRRVLRIREGDSMEIYTDKEGGIVLKKYSAVGEMMPFARQYAESLSSVAGHKIIITDREKVVAIAGGISGDIIGMHISAKIEKIMENRKLYNTANGKKRIDILEEKGFEEYDQIISPIICEGEIVGAVVILGENSGFTDTEGKLAGVAAMFLARQMDSNNWQNFTFIIVKMSKNSAKWLVCGLNSLTKIVKEFINIGNGKRNIRKPGSFAIYAKNIKI